MLLRLRLRSDINQEMDITAFGWYDGSIYKGLAYLAEDEFETIDFTSEEVLEYAEFPE